MVSQHRPTAKFSDSQEGRREESGDQSLHQYLLWCKPTFPREETLTPRSLFSVASGYLREGTGCYRYFDLRRGWTPRVHSYTHTVGVLRCASRSTGLIRPKHRSLRPLFSKANTGPDLTSADSHRWAGERVPAEAEDAVPGDGDGGPTEKQVSREEILNQHLRARPGLKPQVRRRSPWVIKRRKDQRRSRYRIRAPRPMAELLGEEVTQCWNWNIF